MTHPLMSYIPLPGPAAQPVPAPRQGADKYHGEVATGFRAKRENKPKWDCVNRLVKGMLSDLAPGTMVLDVPVGDGRFLHYYLEKGLRCIGVDRSMDMIRQAALTIAPAEQVEAWVARCNETMQALPLDFKDADGKVLVHLRPGDVRALDVEDKLVDVAVMIDLTRWLSPSDCQLAMKQLQRVTKNRIIWTARVANHAEARTIELFESALDGWKITRNHAAHEIDYRVIAAERAA